MNTFYASKENQSHNVIVVFPFDHTTLPWFNHIIQQTAAKSPLNFSESLIKSSKMRTVAITKNI